MLRGPGPSGPISSSGRGACTTRTGLRAGGRAVFPADFMLVGSTNPCPCGHHGCPDGRCSCPPQAISRYRGKLSGPLLDRFDLVVEVPALDAATLSAMAPGESSSEVRRRVVAAHRRQVERGEGGAVRCNARLDAAELKRWAEPGGDGRRLLLAAVDRMGLSARGFDRVRRVARTLADLDGAAAIGSGHVAEALQYRHRATGGVDFG